MADEDRSAGGGEVPEPPRPREAAPTQSFQSPQHAPPGVGHQVGNQPPPTPEPYQQGSAGHYGPPPTYGPPSAYAQPAQHGQPPAYAQPPEHGQFTQGFNPTPGYPGSGPYPAYGRQEDLGARFAAAGAGAAAMTTRVTSQVSAMPWQEKVMRLPGVLGVLAGLLVLISTVTTWWRFGFSGGGNIYGFEISPFLGFSASTGHQFTDAAMMQTFTTDEIESIENISLVIGVLLVVAALILIIAGMLVAMGKAVTLGPAMLVLGLLVLVVARLASEMAGNFSETVQGLSSILGSFGLPDDDPFGFSALGSVVVEAGLGVGITTFALWLLALALIVYGGMIIYREVVHIRRWTA